MTDTEARAILRSRGVPEDVIAASTIGPGAAMLTAQKHRENATGPAQNIGNPRGVPKGDPRPAKARHQPGRMNATEERYSRHLTSLGLRWWFEAVTLRLGDDCRFTADFLVQREDGTLELHDVKAWWKKAKKVGVTEDAMVKWKTAAEMFPIFAFVIAWEQDGEWKERRAR